jgi:hypothetical protein
MPVSKDPTYQPITEDDNFVAGDDITLTFDRISDVSGAAQNITGWTLQFKMAATTAGASVLTKSATLTSPTTGVATVATLAADTSGLAPGTYFYALSRTDSGNNAVVAHGPAVLLGRPT